MVAITPRPHDRPGGMAQSQSGKPDPQKFPPKGIYPPLVLDKQDVSCPRFDSTPPRNSRLLAGRPHLTSLLNLRLEGSRGRTCGTIHKLITYGRLWRWVHCMNPVILEHAHITCNNFSSSRFWSPHTLEKLLKLFSNFSDLS